MPELSGVETFWKLKADPLLADTPVIFVTSHQESALELEVLELGAVDFISKPINPALLKARVSTQLRLKLLTDDLRAAAGRDGLTGIANRRQLDQRLDNECRRALRSSSPLSLLMLDVDHFKAYNDHAGHLAGDEALKQVARTLADSARRAGELVARYGGEEFAVILPGVDAEAARTRAEEIRSSLEAKAIRHPQSKTAAVVTVSVGVSTLQSTANSAFSEEHLVQALIGHADAALYRAKREGRNRVCYEVCLYQPPPHSRSST